MLKYLKSCDYKRTAYRLYRNSIIFVLFSCFCSLLQAKFSLPTAMQRLYVSVSKDFPNCQLNWTALKTSRSNTTQRVVATCDKINHNINKLCFWYRPAKSICFQIDITLLSNIVPLPEDARIESPPLSEFTVLNGLKFCILEYQF